MTASDLEPTDAVGYSRVTLIGRRKRADLVLPSTEPIGALLPEILEILDESTTGTPRRLGVATATGNLLSVDLTLAGAGVVDGAVLRLVAEDEIPPPPVVNDVTEETANDLERHRGRWVRRGRTVLSTALAGTATALAGVELIIAAPARDAFLTLTVAAVGCWVLAVLARLLRQSEIAVAWSVCGAVCGVGVGLVAEAAHNWTIPDRLGCAIAAAWIGIGLAGGVLRRRGPMLGAAFGLVLTIGWVALRRSALHTTEADAIVSIVSVIALGLLPRWALTVSGLASLDDRRLAGDQVSRRTLESSLLAAHSGLIWATIAAAADFAVTAAALADTSKPWPIGLAAAGGAVVLLRSRTLPLSAEVVATLTAGAVVAVTLELDWLEGGKRLALPLATTVAAGGLLIGSLLLDPPAHIRARLRGLADRAETAAVLALVPLLVGVFGVFGRLLHTF